MRAGDVDLSKSTVGPRNTLEASVTLPEPASRLRVVLPRGEAGRAEAVLQERSWAAKHYWQETSGVMTYEFDEPLPAGRVILRIAFTPA